MKFEINSIYINKVKRITKSFVFLIESENEELCSKYCKLDLTFHWSASFLFQLNTWSILWYFLLLKFMLVHIIFIDVRNTIKFVQDCNFSNK